MMNTIYTFHVRYQCLALLLFCSTLHAWGQEARVSLTDAQVTGDSLFLSLKMDLSSIRLNSRTCLHFTPILANSRGGRVELPPVLVSGRRRYRFDRREWALGDDSKVRRVEPYLIQPCKRHSAPRPVSYHVGVPYSVWMGDAALLLRQEVKDCCDLQLLGVDTISGRLFSERVVVQRPEPVRQPIATQQPVSYSARDVELYVSMLSFLEPTVEPAKKLDEKEIG